MTKEDVRTSSCPFGAIISLTLDVYRLALLGRVDFENRWAALEAAAQYVVDGDAKTAAIRANLLPIVEHLTEIGQKVDSLELLAARHWFHNLPCTPNQSQAAAAAGQEAAQ